MRDFFNRIQLQQTAEELPPHLSERPHSSDGEVSWSGCIGRRADRPRAAAIGRYRTDGFGWFLSRSRRSCPRGQIAVQPFGTTEELRQTLLPFCESYDTTWLIERHGFAARRGDVIGVGGARAEAGEDMPMKKVAVIGNAGGGKSTLSRQLAEVTGLPLYALDILQFRGGRYRPDEKDGGKLPDEEYVSIHREILRRDEWIIDGFGSLPTVWERLSAADTLVYIDLPITTHYWGVTKRFVAGVFQNPKGWPENSPVWESTLDGYRVVWLCHRGLTPRYRQRIADEASSKRVHHLTSRVAMKAFLQAAANGIKWP
jgi:adenylate kinase family enzyme